MWSRLERRLFFALLLMSLFDLLSSSAFAHPFLKDQQESAELGIACLEEKTLAAQITLIEVIERTLCNHPQTKQAWAMIKQQRAQVGIAKSRYWPQLSASYQFNRGTSNYQVKDYPELSYDSDLKSHGYSIEANWTVFDFGARSSEIKQYKFLLAAAYANQDAIIQGVLAESIKAYFNLNGLQSSFYIASEFEHLALHNLQAAQAKHQAGIVSLSDVLQAKTNLSRAKVERIKANGELQTAKGALAVFMGVPVNTPYQLVSQKPQIQSDGFNTALDELLRHAQRTHPELRSAHAEIMAAEQHLSMLQRQKWPTLSIVANTSQNSQLGTPPADTNTSSMNFGVQLSMPLFDGFARKNQEKLAQAEMQNKTAIFEEKSQQVALEVWRNYYALQTLTQTFMLNEELLENAQKLYDVELGRYKAGVGTMLEVLTAQNSLIESKQRINLTYAEWQTTRANLLRDLGELGLWSLSS